MAPHGDLSNAHIIDLQGATVSPGFLELQTNGLRGFHFTHFDEAASYAAKIDEVARYLPQTGVTGFWATIPTVHSDEFKKVTKLGPPLREQCFSTLQELTNSLVDPSCPLASLD